MREVRRINYTVKDGEHFKVKVFSIDKTRHHTVTYQITTWALHHTKEVQSELRKLSKKCRINLFQNLDMDLFKDDWIVIDNIAQTKPISKQTTLIIEFTLYFTDEFQREYIEYKFNEMTDKMNDVFQDYDSFSFSQNKHKLEYVL